MIRFYAEGISCGKYVKLVKENRELQNLWSWWIAGFVTGTNLAKTRLTSTDNEAHEAWLLKYCQDNPLDLFINAAAQLDKMLDAK